jgi:hypothetical protein
MERTGIEPVTSGLQSLGSTISSWGNALADPLVSPFPEGGSFGVTARSTLAHRDEDMRAAAKTSRARS